LKQQDLLPSRSRHLELLVYALKGSGSGFAELSGLEGLRRFGTEEGCPWPFSGFRARFSTGWEVDHKDIRIDVESKV